MLLLFFLWMNLSDINRLCGTLSKQTPDVLENITDVTIPPCLYQYITTVKLSDISKSKQLTRQS